MSLTAAMIASSSRVAEPAAPAGEAEIHPEERLEIEMAGIEVDEHLLRVMKPRFLMKAALS